MKTQSIAVLSTIILVLIIIFVIFVLSSIELVNLTNDPDDSKSMDNWSVITPDGNYVVFIKNQGPGKRINCMEAEYGATETEIYDLSVRGYPLSVSDLLTTANGDDYLVCFDSRRFEDNNIIYVLPILHTVDDPQPEISISGIWSIFPYMSGDGRHVVSVKTIPGPDDNNQVERWQRNNWDIMYRGVNDDSDDVITNNDSLWQKSPTVSNNEEIFYVEHKYNTNLPNDEQIQHWKIILVSSSGTTEIESDMQSEHRIKPDSSPHCGNFGSATYPMVSSNGKSVIYVSNWKLIIISDFDTANPTQITLVDTLKVLHYSISQNGRWIAYSAVDSRFGGYSHIYRIRDDGTKNRQLTYDDFNDDYPSISNNGRKITFTRQLDQSDPCNPWEREIFLVKVGSLVDKL
jgi:hypothetical protein